MQNSTSSDKTNFKRPRNHRPKNQVTVIPSASAVSDNAALKSCAYAYNMSVLRELSCTSRFWEYVYHNYVQTSGDVRIATLCRPHIGAFFAKNANKQAKKKLLCQSLP